MTKNNLEIYNSDGIFTQKEIAAFAYHTTTDKQEAIEKANADDSAIFKASQTLIKCQVWVMTKETEAYTTTEFKTVLDGKVTKGVARKIIQEAFKDDADLLLLGAHNIRTYSENIYYLVKDHKQG